jgi:PAS domain S-box-containing protein
MVVPELLDRLNLQFEHMPIACIVLDAEQRIFEWSPAAKAIFGYTREEVAGREMAALLLTRPASVPLEGVRRLLASGDVNAHAVTENVTKDGRRIVCEWHYTPLRSSNGQVIALLAMAQDVTERRQAEQTLVEARERLLAGMVRIQEVSTRLVPAGAPTDLLLDIVDTAMAVTDADMGNIQLLDHRTDILRIVANRGFDAPFLEVFREVPRGVWACWIAMEAGQRVIVENVATSSLFAGTRTGEVLLQAGVRAVQSTPLVGRSGRLVGVLSTYWHLPNRPVERDLGLIDVLARQAADWIERNQAEQALQASEERFRRYFDLGLIGMAITTPEKGALEVNDHLCEILGWTRDELLRVTWAHITHPDDVAEDQAQFDRVIAGEIDGYSIDKRWLRKDGQVVYTAISVNCVRRRDGAVDYFVALVQDITGRKHAEGALRESEERYRSLISQVRDYAIFSADERGAVTTWNEGCQQVLGYGPEEFVGLNCAKLFSAEDQAAQTLGTQFWQPIQSGAARIDRWMSGKSGRRFYAMGTITALTDSARRLMGFSVVLRDTTKMKLREDELARRGEDLARLVSERTDELQRTTEQLRLSERMASLGTLAAGLGHDLGNLLLPIDIRLKLLLDADLPGDLRDHIVGIEKGTAYLQRLASGLRSLAVDPEASLDGETTELGDWWNDVAIMLRNVVPRGIAFERELPAMECWVAIKPVSLTQVVFNLVQNAADALQGRADGSIRVTASESADGAAVHLQVGDNGAGMSQDVINRCMEPYFSTKARGASTGMGLSFVHRLVTGAGGRVDMSSILGQGTVVTLTLARTTAPNI